MKQTNETERLSWTFEDGELQHIRIPIGGGHIAITHDGVFVVDDNGGVTRGTDRLWPDDLTRLGGLIEEMAAAVSRGLKVKPHNMELG